ncbi:MAG: hypothetical protein J6K38_06550 [Alistipes sp.]|nr:hypothetical protein [Alistipes sp.]
MNKLIHIFILALSAAALAVSCSSSGDKSVNTTPESLAETSWFGECEDDKTGAKYEVTLTFPDGENCKWVLRDDIGDIYSSTDYTYEYTMPNLTLYAADEQDPDTVKTLYNGFVLDKDQAQMNGYNVYTLWLYDTKGNLAASFWKF